MEGQIYVKENSLWISRTELEIIKALIQGKTSKEIARETGRAVKTIDAHKYKVMRRLNCKRMPQLVGLLYEKKILPDGNPNT